MENTFENFTVTVLKLNKLVNKIKVHEMREYGLKAIHVMCIYYLDQNARPLTQSELCRLTLEDKAAISRGLALLREKGYAHYDPDKYNAEIRLTDEGKKLAEIVAEKSERAVSAGSAFSSEKQRALFYDSLHTIAENLNEYYNTIIKE